MKARPAPSPLLEPLAVEGLISGPQHHARIVAAQEINAVEAELLDACDVELRDTLKPLITRALTNALVRGYHLGQAEQAVGLVMAGVDVGFDFDWSQALEITDEA